MSQEPVNFLPADYVEKRTQARWNQISIVLFVLVMIATVGAWWVARRGLVELESQQAGVNAQLEAANKQLTELEKLQEQRRLMITKAETSALLLERVPRSVLIKSLGEMLPEGGSIRNVSINTVAAAGSSAPVPKGTVLARPTTDVMVRLTGWTREQKDFWEIYAEKIKKNPIFYDVVVGQVKSNIKLAHGYSVCEFNLTMKVNQYLDLQDLVKFRKQNDLSSEVAPATAPATTQKASEVNP
ncbi:MAG: hypothetical protein WCJ97_06900 [Phycisphaerae bacterium]